MPTTTVNPAVDGGLSVLRVSVNVAAKVSDRESRALLARVDTLIDSWRALRHAQFATQTMTADAQAAKSGAFNGSEHRQNLHAMCAVELAARREHLCSTLIETHKAVSGSPRAALRTGAKDWIAHCLHREAIDLTRLLPKPREAFDEAFPAERLVAETERETKAANAAIDNAFDTLARDRAERFLRSARRALRFLLRGS